jgi:hypothetical protein
VDFRRVWIGGEVRVGYDVKFSISVLKWVFDVNVDF